MLIANKNLEKDEELFIDYRVLNHPDVFDVVQGVENSLEIQIEQMKKLYNW